MTNLTFTITNLNCDACVKMSTMILRKLPGVTEATVELATGAGHVVSSEPITQSDVATALKEKGYITTF